MTEELAASYEHCRRIARSRARNFYYSFVLLPKPKRDAMCAVYAFMRYCDDLSDEPSEGGPAAVESRLERWRRELDSALAGSFGDNPTWPALVDTVRRYGIPARYLHEMIDGVSTDLEPRRVETFEELYRYCYQVASVVGLSIIHIFGFHRNREQGWDQETEARALDLAEKCGIAFQLTNILRDVREDYELGRIYLPREDLERFQVPSEDLGAGTPSEAFLRMMRFESARARSYYDESAPLIGLVEPASRSSLWAMIAIYSRLLERIERKGYDVLSGRVRLSALEKAWIVARAAAGAVG